MSYDKIAQLLELAIQKRATDVHLTVGQPPIFRIHGELEFATDMPVLRSEDVEHLIYPMMNDTQRMRFLDLMELDLSYYGDEKFHFRVNVHIEKGNLAANIRLLPMHILTSQELGLPGVVTDFGRRRNGLIMIVGPAGSGKTTTLNYMVDLINRERKAKIITVEDPIEYVHQSKKSLVIQREVGLHTKSFANALKAALRQDPDVIVIGEIRDLESIAIALTAAETGHLVLTTLHAPDTIETINRIIDVFPDGKRNQVMTQLAENLIGIISQNLIPLQYGGGRVLATEVLNPTLSIRNIIRRGALQEIRGQMMSEEGGMFTLEQCLSRLVKSGQLSHQYACQFSKYPNQISRT